MSYQSLKERLEFINRALKSSQFSPEEREDLLWQYECCKREIANCEDTEYNERVAKMKVEAAQDDINNKLVIRRK
jgi:hypothetical protein